MIVPSVVVVGVVPVNAVFDPRGASAVMTATRGGSRHTHTSQCKSGHEGHEEFPVVRFITIAFLPFWALHSERRINDGNLTKIIHAPAWGATPNQLRQTSVGPRVHGARVLRP